MFLSTNCIQTFEFVGATISNSNVPTVWILEDVSGECYSTKLIQVSLSDTNISYTESNIKHYMKAASFKKSFPEFEQIPQFELTNVDGRFQYYNRVHFSIQEPVVDSTMLAQYFNDGIRKYPLPVQMPLLNGVSAKLLYSYSSGLYVNYQITKVIFIPTQKLLIVFTKNSFLASGGDSMHGFMIFSININ